MSGAHADKRYRFSSSQQEFNLIGGGIGVLGGDSLEISSNTIEGNELFLGTRFEEYKQWDRWVYPGMITSLIYFI